MGDQCAQGVIGWTSENSSDYDSDGCKDSSLEDDDDDNDLVLDDNDLCPYGIIGLSVENDTDRDGCIDTFEPINVGLNSVFASITGQENTTYEWELDANSTLPISLVCSMKEMRHIFNPTAAQQILKKHIN